MALEDKGWRLFILLLRLGHDVGTLKDHMISKKSYIEMYTSYGFNSGHPTCSD